MGDFKGHPFRGNQYTQRSRVLYDIKKGQTAELISRKEMARKLKSVKQAAVKKLSPLSAMFGEKPSRKAINELAYKAMDYSPYKTNPALDIKIKGITQEIMAQALEQARQARLAILGKMLETLPAPRPDLKTHAPRITVIRIPVDKIGAVIGPGGKMIRSIHEETNTRIDIEEDGSIFIAATDGKGEQLARDSILSLTEVPEIGRIYTGRVVRIADFGVFVEILPNTDGMVHISQFDTERVERVEDVVRMGDEITVMVTDIDPAGKIRLSRQAVLEGWTAEEAASRDRGGGRRPGGSGGSGRRDDRRGGSQNRNRR